MTIEKEIEELCERARESFKVCNTDFLAGRADLAEDILAILCANKSED